MISWWWWWRVKTPFLTILPCVSIAPSMSYSVGNPHRKSISQDSKHEEQSSQESQNGNNVTKEFPDGGTRAWIVVIGVRVVLSPTIHWHCSKQRDIRQRVPVTRRKSHVIDFWISIQHLSSVSVLSTHGVYVVTVRSIGGIMRLFK